MNFSALNTHAIGVIAASAVVEVEGAGSFNAGASASAQATLHSHATATAINSVALTTTQSVVRFATAIATLGCSAAANVDGYRVQFSNAEIVCAASSNANAVVHRQAVVYVTAQATNVAVGSRVAYASALLEADAHLTANSGKVIFAQASILAFSDVSANSGMVHDVEAHISGLSIAISAAEKIAVSHTQLTCIAALSAEAYSESKASVAVVCTADIAGDAYVPNPVFAEVAIVAGYYENQVVWTPISSTRFGIKTGYFTDLSGNKHWKVAQYVLRPGQYWTVEYGSATGDDQYGSFWDTYRLDGDMREGSSQGWNYPETKQFSYLGATYSVNFQIPVHDIEQSSIQSVWIDTPLPSAEVIAEALVTTGSLAQAICLASVSSQPVIHKRVVADINASASLSASATEYHLSYGLAEIGSSSEVSASAVSFASAQAAFAGSATIDETSNRLIFGEASVADTGYWTQGYWTDPVYSWVSTGLTINWVNGTWSSGNYFSYPYRDAGHLDTIVTGGNTTVRHSVEENVITTASVFIPTFWTDTGTGPAAEVTAEASTFTRVIQAQASIDAACSVSADAGKAIMASATVSSTGYSTPAHTINITTWSNVPTAWVFRSSSSNYSRWYHVPNAADPDYWVASNSDYPIVSQGLRLGSSFAYSTYYETDNSTSYTGYSYYIEEPTVTVQNVPEFWTVTGTGPVAEVTAESYIFTHRIVAQASIDATCSVSAGGVNQRSISAEAHIADTGYSTEGYWTDPTYAWVSTDLTINWLNGSFSSGNYYNYPYRDAGYLDTIVTGSDTLVRYSVEENVITVASVFIPTFWTVTGTSPAAEVTASGLVYINMTADLECSASIASQTDITRFATANILSSASLSASANKYHLSYGSAEVNASSEVAAERLDDLLAVISGAASLAASADVTAESYVKSWRSVEIASVANVATTPVVIRVANAELISNSELSAQPSRQVVGSVNATATVAVSVPHPYITRFSSASIDVSAQVGEQAYAHAYVLSDVVCTAQLTSESYVARTIPAVPLEGTADFDVEFTIVVQEGTRSNGILILVEAENRAIAVEDIDRSILVELDARTVYAEAA